MSECRCEFQGKPVTGHFSYCPVRKDERIAELEAELAALKEKALAAVNAPYDDILDMRQALRDLGELL